MAQIIIIIIGFVYHSFNFNQFAKMLYVPCTFLISKMTLHNF